MKIILVDEELFGVSYSTIKWRNPPDEMRTEIVRVLQERDGRNCFYCDQPMFFGDEPLVKGVTRKFTRKHRRTIEHLVSKEDWRVGSLCLAHGKCNSLAGPPGLYINRYRSLQGDDASLEHRQNLLLALMSHEVRSLLRLIAN